MNWVHVLQWLIFHSEMYLGQIDTLLLNCTVTAVDSYTCKIIILDGIDNLRCTWTVAISQITTGSKCCTIATDFWAVSHNLTLSLADLRCAWNSIIGQYQLQVCKKCANCLSYSEIGIQYLLDCLYCVAELELNPAWSSWMKLRITTVFSSQPEGSFIMSFHLSDFEIFSWPQVAGNPQFHNGQIFGTALQNYVSRFIYVQSSWHEDSPELENVAMGFTYFQHYDFKKVYYQWKLH